MNTAIESPKAPDTGFFGHPKGLATLFFTEFGERFGYYGMRALLILFMTKTVAEGGLGFEIGKASAIYGLFTSMVYLVSLPGGWIADRLLGQQMAVLLGGLLIAGGYFSLAAPSETVFYLGLCVVILGTGLLKPNISTIVGQLYSQGDTRRDAGFSIFYMGINMGAFFSPLVCGWIAREAGWRMGMAAAGLGMAAGVLVFVGGRHFLGDAGRHPVSDEKVAASRLWGGLVLVLAVGLGVWASGITAQQLNDAALYLIIGLTLGVFLWMLFGAKWTPVERKRIYVIGLLFLASCLFWSAFEQAGSTLNLFADRNTDNRIFGWEYPASWLQSLNGLFIWTLAPVFAVLWMKLGSREPSSPAKFAWGLVLVGLGYVVLIAAAFLGAGGNKVSPLWLTATYLLHTFGELCLSPVGLSAYTKLAPARVAGFMMGFWFLSISVGNYMGGRMAGLYESLPLPTLFAMVGLFAIGAGLILALFVKPIKALMGGVK